MDFIQINLNYMDEMLQEGQFFTLTDEEGNEIEFELIATCEMSGATYFAMVTDDDPAEGEPMGEDEYVILKKETDEDGEDVLITIEDDEEFDRVADYFDNYFAKEADEVNHDE